MGCASSAEKSAALANGSAVKREKSWKVHQPAHQQETEASNREPPISQFSGSGAKDEPEVVDEEDAANWAADLAAHHSQRRHNSIFVRQQTGTEIFLTHDWANDEMGRNNHDRVKKVYQRLKELGVTAWFDEEAMRGDINHTMAAGIDAAQTVGVFITNRYIDKASGKGAAGANDNCKFEFDYALRKKGVDKMIVLVMEPSCRNTADWDGVVGGKLGGKLFIDLSEDGPPFEEGVHRLVKEIRASVSRPCSATAEDSPHPQHRTASSQPGSNSSGRTRERRNSSSGNFWPPPEKIAAQPRAVTRKLTTLSVEEVCTLLVNLDMGKHVEGFRALPVNGAVLDCVEDEDLQQVGVVARMHRKALLKHVEEFQAWGVPLELLAISED